MLFARYGTRGREASTTSLNRPEADACHTPPGWPPTLILSGGPFRCRVALPSGAAGPAPGWFSGFLFFFYSRGFWSLLPADGVSGCRRGPGLAVGCGVVGGPWRTAGWVRVSPEWRTPIGPPRPLPVAATATPPASRSTRPATAVLSPSRAGSRRRAVARPAALRQAAAA